MASSSSEYAASSPLRAQANAGSDQHAAWSPAAAAEVEGEHLEPPAAAEAQAEHHNAMDDADQDHYDVQADNNGDATGDGGGEAEALDLVAVPEGETMVWIAFWFAVSTPTPRM